ncbi:MAG: hypothetical protein HXY41_11660 [Chloroflexi bacterium]|nr:hypothetical protein [Chloroflexota bacterium]
MVHEHRRSDQNKTPAAELQDYVTTNEILLAEITRLWQAGRRMTILRIIRESLRLCREKALQR